MQVVSSANMIFVNKQHVAAMALAAIPASALICGLAAMAISRSDLATWIFIAGIVPVLLALLWSIVKSLLRGEYGLDIIAALSMSGALLADEALAGVVVALMYSGGLLLEDYAQGRAMREMTALLGRVARTAQAYRNGILVETAIELLVPGDRLLIRAGEVVPADGAVESGSALLDESSLTVKHCPCAAMRVQQLPVVWPMVIRLSILSSLRLRP